MMLVTEAYLSALFFQTFFYGISVATFVECLRVLVGNAATYASSPTIRRGLLTVATIMFINATIGSIRIFWGILAAFVYVVDEPGGINRVFLDLTEPPSIIFTIMLVIQILLGDGTLLFRTWAAYNRSWIKISIPLVILMTDFGFGCCIILFELGLSKLKGNRIFSERFRVIVTWYIALTLVCNMLCTAMITVRLWTVTRRAAKLRLHEDRKSRAGYLHTAARLILESGLIYAASTAVELGVIVSGDTAFYTVSSCIVPITTICFHLIIIRANWHRTDDVRRDASVFDVSDDGSLAWAVNLRVQNLREEDDSV